MLPAGVARGSLWHRGDRRRVWRGEEEGEADDGGTGAGRIVHFRPGVVQRRTGEDVSGVPCLLRRGVVPPASAHDGLPVQDRPRESRRASAELRLVHLRRLRRKRPRVRAAARSSKRAVLPRQAGPHPVAARAHTNGPRSDRDLLQPRNRLARDRSDDRLDLCARPGRGTCGRSSTSRRERPPSGKQSLAASSTPELLQNVPEIGRGATAGAATAVGP